MKNIPLLVGTLVVTIILIVGLAFFFSTPEETKNVDQQLLMGSTQNVKGNPAAKVTIVEFSDFQCPACRTYEANVEEVLKKYGNEVFFAYRHFPLVQIHKNAQLASYAAESAASFGKFWEFHDMVFATQDEWKGLSADQAKQKFAEYAEKLQIDKNEFLKRIDSSELHQRVTDDVADASKIGVDSTPTFFVNGLETAAPQLQETVESLLSSTKE